MQPFYPEYYIWHESCESAQIQWIVRKDLKQWISVVKQVCAILIIYYRKEPRSAYRFNYHAVVVWPIFIVANKIHVSGMCYFTITIFLSPTFNAFMQLFELKQPYQIYTWYIHLIILKKNIKLSSSKFNQSTAKLNQIITWCTKTLFGDT